MGRYSYKKTVSVDWIWCVSPGCRGAAQQNPYDCCKLAPCGVGYFVTVGGGMSQLVRSQCLTVAFHTNPWHIHIMAYNGGKLYRQNNVFRMLIQKIHMNIWVRSQNYGCLVTWFCYHLIAKPGNKTAAVP